MLGLRFETHGAYELFPFQKKKRAMTSFFNLLDGMMDRNDPKSPAKLYQHDISNAVRWGFMGGAALALYQLVVRVVRRQHNPTAELLDRQDALHLDTVVLDSFVELQAYRPLNTYLFSQSVHYVDRLLLLEDVLRRGEVVPERGDKTVAWVCFKGAINRLTELQYEVKDKLGAQHALAVNIIVTKIYEQLKKHLMNVLHLTRQFSVADMLKQAEKAIQEAQRTDLIRQRVYREEEDQHHTR